MKKNMNNKEANIHTIVSIILLLIALLAVDNAFIKIILATISASLAVISFLRYCPLKKFIKKYINENSELKDENTAKTNEDSEIKKDKTEEIEDKEKDDDNKKNTEKSE